MRSFRRPWAETEQSGLCADEGGGSDVLKLDNALVTPHAAWYSQEAVASLPLKAAQEAARVLSGQPPLNPVNHPEQH